MAISLVTGHSGANFIMLEMTRERMPFYPCIFFNLIVNYYFECPI